MSGGGPRVVVVGNGMAGFRFVQELLDRVTGLDVSVVGDEPGSAYNRARLPLVLAGTALQDSIELADAGWYAARGVRLVPGTASRIDRARHVLELADGPVLPYDLLVLAAGSAPVVPPADGLAGPDGGLPAGAVAFRTLADCTEIRARTRAARHAVVLGGGVLGLETACGLAGGGLPVTVVQRAPRLIERQLDADAARVLARTARALGVTVRAGTSVTTIRGAGRVTGVMLGDGGSIDADLLVLCCGTRPRTGLARAAGLALGAGVIVDDHMRTTDPDIFAIGDCAEHRGRTHGLVAAAWAQARVAAHAVAARAGGVTAGPGSVRTGSAGPRSAGSDPADPEPMGQDQDGYADAPPVVRLKAAGIELAVLGSARGGRGEDVIRVTDHARGVYQKLVVRDGRLVGAILLGDTRAAGTLTQLFERGAELPGDRLSLLAARRDGAAPAGAVPAAMPWDATVCQCNGVTKAAIRTAWESGARDAGQVAARTRASTGCGTCRDTVEEVVAWLAEADRAWPA